VVDFDLNSLFMLRFHTDVLGFSVSCAGASGIVGVVGLGTLCAEVGDSG
jgi:hypothetical protein